MPSAKEYKARLLKGNGEITTHCNLKQQNPSFYRTFYAGKQITGPSIPYATDFNSTYAGPCTIPDPISLSIFISFYSVGWTKNRLENFHTELRTMTDKFYSTMTQTFSNSPNERFEYYSQGNSYRKTIREKLLDRPSPLMV